MAVSAPGGRVLACDDEPQILRALKVILRSAGYTVVPAADIREPLEVVRGSPVDAAIVDLVLARARPVRAALSSHLLA
jgi:two-component system KDP operon response regulator KdpE